MLHPPFAHGRHRGGVEMANALLINKADGDNKLKAEKARSEYEHALHYLQPPTDGWTTRAYTCSALTGEGISEIRDTIEDFKRTTVESGEFECHRREQLVKWVKENLHSLFICLFSRVPEDFRQRAFAGKSKAERWVAKRSAERSPRAPPLLRGVETERRK